MSENTLNPEIFYILNSGGRMGLILNNKPACCLWIIVSGLAALKLEVTETYDCICIAVLTFI